MITINVDKAKIISHSLRREARSIEFQPYDSVVSKQIPGEVEQAEQERKKIREKYTAYQTQIDSASTVEELKEIIKFQ